MTIEEQLAKALRERDEDRETANRLRMFYTGCELDRRRLANELEVMREDRINCWRERAELMRVNKGVARHGIITESVRQLTELLGIERQNPSANETTDAAAVEIKRLRAEVEQLKAQHLERHLESWEQHMQDNDVKRAFRRGAEAMRVEVMQYLVRQQNEATVMVVDTAIKGVHTLPIPEEP